MERLGSLYHWSPTPNRQKILREGLVPASPSMVATSELGYICLGPTPRKAWTYSGDLEWAQENDDWDLWQVSLADRDEVRIRMDYGMLVIEVKVHNVIPPDRLWWVGQRQPWLIASPHTERDA